VSRAGWTSALLALLLVVSLTNKFLVGYYHGGGDNRRLAVELQRRLTANGFATSAEPTLTGIVIHGKQGSCRLTARDGDEWAALSVLFQERARAYGSLHYVYRGTVRAAPPRADLLMDRVTYRMLHAFGISWLRPALLAVAVTPACDLVALGRIFDGVTMSFSDV
jgi:hypothetical protein